MAENTDDTKGFSGDDAPELTWNEFDWEAHLKPADTLARDYSLLYAELADQPNRLELMARAMGWDVDEENEGHALSFTLERHPVYVTCRALFNDVQTRWLQLLDATTVSPRRAAQFAIALAETERASLLATHSLDSADWSLSVCQFKRAMSPLNRLLALLAQFDAHPDAALRSFCAFARLRLFDIRELWLSCMREARHADLEDAEDMLDDDEDDEA